MKALYNKAHKDRIYVQDHWLSMSTGQSNQTTKSNILLGQNNIVIHANKRKVVFCALSFFFPIHILEETPILIKKH